MQRPFAWPTAAALRRITRILQALQSYQKKRAQVMVGPNRTKRSSTSYIKKHQQAHATTNRVKNSNTTDASTYLKTIVRNCDARCMLAHARSNNNARNTSTRSHAAPPTPELHHALHVAHSHRALNSQHLQHNTCSTNTLTHKTLPPHIQPTQA